VKRLMTTVLATAALLLVVAGPAAAASGDGHVDVEVMKHLCNPDVRNIDDFNAIIEAADGPVAALAATVLACPTVVNPGDETTDGVKGDAIAFSFTVEDADGTHQLPNNTDPAKLCETDLGLDADGDGNISDDVCLDISYYAFEGLVSGHITVTETEPPAGTRFGALLTTPTEVDGNNDADSIVSVDAEAGVIELDTSADEDGMVMLHVYNFQTLPDSSTAAEAASESAPMGLLLALVLGIAATFGAWLSIGLRRREGSIS